MQILKDELRKASDLARDKAAALRDLRLQALTVGDYAKAEDMLEEREQWIQWRKDFERAYTSASAVESK